MREVTRFALLALHVWIMALYYGALSYSYARLYRQMREFLGSGARYEEFAITVGAGLRWWVFGVFASMGLTGAGLLALRWHDPHSTTWWALMAGKGVLLVYMTAIYAYASWVMWPARIFAAPEEVPRIQRRFTVVAYLIGTANIAEILLSAAAHVW